MRCRDVLPIVLGVSVLGSVACGSDAEPADGPDGAVSADAIQLDSAQLATSDPEVVLVGALPPDTLQLTGWFTYEPTRVSHVGPRMAGRVRRVDVEVGVHVEAGDTLAVLDSPELGAAQATWFQAAVARDVARRNWERIERLFEDGIVSERRRLEGEAELRKSESSLAAAERALSSLGAEPDSLSSGVFVLRSPMAGEIVEKHATAGEVVGPENTLFTVADISVLWSILDAYESDLAQIKEGAHVNMGTDAYPGRHFSGQVTYVASILDTISRTVKVRVEIPNLDRALKPGMFARARLVTAEEEPPIGVPADAVQTVDGRMVVFVPEGGGRFRLRPVTIGKRRAGGWVEILDGLAPGDSVVAHGSFALKAELQKSSFAEDE
jgi:cobalt-zinc-cadmium efflux system membrane fusion protein